ncbi:DUF4372 domain-containing protein [Duodenibacillus massiliensis]|uniref:DUF4372 domain-containing protein n=1 Tax=Duodenibacillus massiliensis TaxID=1852381 RepID=UPI003A9031E7
MNSVGLHVFAQLLKVLPMDTFEAIAAKYPLKPCNSRKFTPRDYFTAMLFGQLSGASPLREVVLGMAIAGEKIVHTGAKFMKRTGICQDTSKKLVRSLFIPEEPQQGLCPYASLPQDIFLT